jgi:hypothetical protein
MALKTDCFLVLVVSSDQLDALAFQQTQQQTLTHLHPLEQRQQTLLKLQLHH